MHEESVLAPAESESGLSPDAGRMVEEITNLAEVEREVFDLVRIQGCPRPRPPASPGLGRDRDAAVESLVILAGE
jgi:hypothetical protein